LIVVESATQGTAAVQAVFEYTVLLHNSFVSEAAGLEMRSAKTCKKDYIHN
jgi:hypothetical protein